MKISNNRMIKEFTINHNVDDNPKINKKILNLKFKIIKWYKCFVKQEAGEDVRMRNGFYAAQANVGVSPY